MNGIALALLLCAGAQDGGPPPSPPPAQKPELSREDAELVKELALLERMELVKNLELFEPDKPQGQKQASP